MGLEKVCDRVDSGVLWQVQRMYSIDGKLLRGNSFLFLSKAGVRINSKMREFNFKI